MKRFIYSLFAAVAVFSSFTFAASAEGELFSKVMTEGEGWIRYGNPVRSEIVAGMYYVDSTDTRGGFQSPLPLEAGEYVLSFDAKVEKGYLMPMIGVGSSNYDFEEVYERFTNRDGDDWGWVSYERRFVLPEHFRNDYRLVFQTRNASAYVDNVKIERVEKVERVRFVADMDSFEEWDWYGNAKSVGVLDGLYKVYSLGTRGGFQKNLELEAGREYVLKFDVKVENGYVLPKIGVGSSNYDFEGNYDYLRVRDMDKYGWMSYERKFVLPENENGDYRLVFQSRNAVAYFDNIEIIEMVEGVM